MTNPDFARLLAKSIQERVDPTLPLSEPPQTGGETTHISVMDAQGNAVSLSQSIESIYGAKVAASGLGFLYNNYLNTLEVKDPSHPYYLRPGAAARSNATPTIIVRDGRAAIAIGAAGERELAHPAPRGWAERNGPREGG